MRQVAHIVAVAQPDPIAEVVGDHAVAIVVEADIARQQHRVAPADDALLRDARRLPADQRRQLHQLHHPRRQHRGVAQVHQELQRARAARRSTRAASSRRGPAAPRRDPPWRRPPDCPRPGPRNGRPQQPAGAPSTRAPASGEIRIAGCPSGGILLVPWSDVSTSSCYGIYVLTSTSVTDSRSRSPLPSPRSLLMACSGKSSEGAAAPEARRDHGRLHHVLEARLR